MKMDKINELKALIAGLEEDAIKFYEKENKAAGVRARKTLQEIKSMAQEIRLDISKNKTPKK